MCIQIIVCTRAISAIVPDFGTHLGLWAITKSTHLCYRLLIDRVKASGKTPVRFNLPPVDHKKYFSWISRDLNASNILKWLGGSSEFIYRWHEMYNNAIYKIAQSENVKLIDVRSVFLTQRDYTKYLCQDGIHPNELGHRLIADAAIKQCKQL